MSWLTVKYGFGYWYIKNLGKKSPAELRIHAEARLSVAGSVAFIISLSGRVVKSQIYVLAKIFYFFANFFSFLAIFSYFLNQCLKSVYDNRGLIFI